MVPINIYINGVSGFIGGALVKNIKNNQNSIVFNNTEIPIKIISVPRKLDRKIIYEGIFIQVASPSDIFDFKNKEEMKTSMINDVNNNIEVAIKNNLIFIFCSSLAVEDAKLNEYGKYKLEIENRLKQERLDKKLDSVILRIPRVYSEYRKKGLMFQLRNNMVPYCDFNKEITFMEIDNFIDEVVNYLGKIIIEPKSILNKIISFPNTKNLTIGQIKEYYKL